jgi:hypothetical protein
VRQKRNPHLIWWENLMGRDSSVENLDVDAMIMLNFCVFEIEHKVFEIGWDDVDWIQLAWRSFMSKVMDLGVP